MTTTKYDFWYDKGCPNGNHVTGMVNGTYICVHCGAFPEAKPTENPIINVPVLVGKNATIHIDGKEFKASSISVSKSDYWCSKGYHELKFDPSRGALGIHHCDECGIIINESVNDDPELMKMKDISDRAKYVGMSLPDYISHVKIEYARHNSN